MYKFIYTDIPFLSISRFIKQSSRASLFDEVYVSTLLSRENNIIISAYWPVNDDGFLLRESPLPLSFGQVQYYFKHDLVFCNDSKKQEHLIAYVRRYKMHSHSSWFGSSAVVLENNFEIDSCFSFIPLQRFSSLCIYGVQSISFTDNSIEHVIVASPINNKHL